MKHLLIILAIAAAGCSNKSEAPSAPAAAAKPAAPDERIVELSAEALKEARLEIAPVGQRSVPLSIRANGRLATNENATWRVGAVTDGRVIRVEAKVGDTVKKGQVLARLHSHEIHESRALYRRALADESRLKSNLEFARRSRDRQKKLYELKAASLEQLDHSENELKNVQTALQNAEVEVARTRLHLVEFLEVSLEGPEEHGHDTDPAAHVDDLIPIKAPESGTLVVRNVTPGAVISAANDLFVVCDLSTIWATAAVQEEHLSKIRTGMQARVSVQAYAGRTFTGRVLRIDETLDAATRTVQVRIELPNKSGLLKPEMYATIELEAGGSVPGLFISQSAVQDVNGQNIVFVQVAVNRFDARPVELGRTLDGAVEALRGLRAGDKVVSHGSFILKSQLLKASLSEE